MRRAAWGNGKRGKFTEGGAAKNGWWLDRLWGECGAQLQNLLCTVEISIVGQFPSIQFVSRRLIGSEQIEIQWGHRDNSFKITIHTPQRKAMQKRGGSDQEVWQRNALAFSGKLMTQAGCTLPCLAQEWGLFERRQLLIEGRHPFRSFDADEQFCSNRPTYPHGTCYEEFSQSILQSVMALAIRPNPDAGVDETRPEIKCGHACDGGESGTRLR